MLKNLISGMLYFLLFSEFLVGCGLVQGMKRLTKSRARSVPGEVWHREVSAGVWHSREGCATIHDARVSNSSRYAKEWRRLTIECFASVMKSALAESVGC